MGKKLLFFTAYYFPEFFSSSYLIKDLLEGLSQRGWLIEVYTPVPSRGVTEEQRKSCQRRKLEVKGNVTIHRIPLMKESKKTLSRALRYILMNIKLYRTGRKADGDAIFVNSTPPTQGAMAARIKNKIRKPFVYSLQDIFPDSLVSSGIAKKGSPVWKVGRKIESYTYVNADKIIVIGDDFKNNIMAKGVPESKIVVIPNWADTANIHPVGRGDNLLVSRYNLDPGKFYVTYCGNVGLGQNWDLLLAVAKRIAKKNPDICFVIVGDGAAKENVESRVRNEGIGNVVMLPLQPYEDIAHVFSLGDVGLIISKGGVRDSSVPSKTWNIMAAEKPIISSFDEDSELSRIVRESGCGIAVPADDEDRLEEAVLKAYGEMDLAEAGRLGKAYLDQHLSKDVCVGAYVDVIEAAVAEARQG